MPNQYPKITSGQVVFTCVIIFVCIGAVTCRGDKPFAADLDPTLPNAIKASVFFDPTSSSYVGSGTAIATNGEKTLILTCEHVLSRGDGITVVWYNGHRSKGKVFHRDEDLDIAIAMIDGPALAVAPISLVTSQSQIWAVGFPGRTGPTTRQVEFEGVQRSGQWLFDVKGGNFGRGVSGSGVFQDGRLISMTTGGLGGRRFESTALGVGRNELLEFVKKSAASSPKDCPFNLFDPLGLFSDKSRNRDRERGESRLDLDLNVQVSGKQIPGLPIKIPGLGGDEREQPSNPPREAARDDDRLSRRLDRLEDTVRNLRADMLQDIKDAIAEAMAEVRARAVQRPVAVLGRITEATDETIEDQVEAIMEAKEKLDRDKSKLLSELRRRSESMARLAEQLAEGIEK